MAEPLEENTQKGLYDASPVPKNAEQSPSSSYLDANPIPVAEKKKGPPQTGQQKCISCIRGDTDCGGQEVKSDGTLIRHRMAAEFFGTFFLVFFGTASVANAVLAGAYTGLWSCAMIWGFGLAIAIYATASVSGAHLNPAVSLSLALIRPQDFPFKYLVPYWVSQVLGAMTASIFILIMFNGAIRAHEVKYNYVRGDDASIITATMFAEYFPNPNLRYMLSDAYPGAAIEGLVPYELCTKLNGQPILDVNDDPMCINLPGNPAGLGWSDKTVTVADAFLIEVVSTAVLVFMIFSMTDPRNRVLIGSKDMAPFFIGFTVAVMIAIYAQFTQGCMNPARDLGPRIISAIAGWGSIAIPGPRNEIWLYIVAPMVGGPIGGAFFEFCLGRGLRPDGKKTRIKMGQLYQYKKAADVESNKAPTQSA